MRSLVEGEPEEGRLRDAVDAVCPACKALPVQDDDADDLAEGQRHDGKVIASQPKHRKGKRNAPERRQHAGERETHPKRPAELSRDQRVGVGPDCVKGHIAKIEQPRKAHDDVQAPAEHDVNKDLGRGVDCIAQRSAGDEEGQGDRNDEERNRELPPEIRAEAGCDPAPGIVRLAKAMRAIRESAIAATMTKAAMQAKVTRSAIEPSHQNEPLAHAIRSDRSVGKT